MQAGLPQPPVSPDEGRADGDLLVNEPAESVKFDIRF